MNWIKVPGYVALGQLSRTELVASAWLLPLALANTWGGVHLVRRVDPRRFYALVYVLMVVVGIKLIADDVTWICRRLLL